MPKSKSRLTRSSSLSNTSSPPPPNVATLKKNPKTNSTKYSDPIPKFIPEMHLQYCSLPKSENRKWKTNRNGIDVVFNFQIHGKDSAPHKLIFVNGMGTSLQGHSPQASFFKKHPALFQTAYFDNLGVGFSSPLKPHYNTSLFASDILAFINQVLKWKSFHIYGNSMGGMIIQHILLSILLLSESPAVSAPSTSSSSSPGPIPLKVQSVIFSNTHAGNWLNLFLTPGSCIPLYLRTITQSTKEKMVWSLMDLLFPQDHLALPGTTSEFSTRREELYLKKMAMSKSTRAPTLVSTLAHVGSSQTHHLSHNDLALLSSMDFPKLVLVSEFDGMVYPHATKEFATAIDADYLCSIKGAGHCPHLQFPDKINKILVEFMTSSKLENHPNIENVVAATQKKSKTKTIIIA